MLRSILLTAGLCLATAQAVLGATILLKDGTFVEGKILVQTSKTIRVATRWGERTYQRRDIDKIIDVSDAIDGEAVNKLADLPPVYADVLNAAADYDLGHYDRAAERIKPHLEYSDSKALRMRIDWLQIDLEERMGHWDEAKKLLEDKKKEGTPEEQTRAKAHLDILETNTFKDHPSDNYSLRFVGEVHARNFIRDDELRNRAKEPDALRDDQIFRLAMEEYCKQKLTNEKYSVEAFRGKLRQYSRATYEACRGLKPGSVDKQMPYFDDMKKVEQSLREVRAILDAYGEIYELDLVRVETDHLIEVLQQLLQDLAARSPERAAVAFDQVTGRLTREGKEQWTQLCDDFLAELRIVQRICSYMQEKVEPYPQELNTINAIVKDANELMEEMEKAARKARTRSHV